MVQTNKELRKVMKLQKEKIKLLEGILRITQQELKNHNEVLQKI